MDKIAFVLDLSGIERADNGDTTHFGGTYVVNGEERRGYGELAEGFRAGVGQTTGWVFDTSDAEWGQLRRVL